MIENMDPMSDFDAQFDEAPSQMLFAICESELFRPSTFEKLTARSMAHDFEKYIKSMSNCIKLARTIQTFCKGFDATLLFADGDCDMLNTGNRYDSYWVSPKKFKQLTGPIFRQI